MHDEDAHTLCGRTPWRHRGYQRHAEVLPGISKYLTLCIMFINSNKLVAAMETTPLGHACELCVTSDAITYRRTLL